jgi:hypothetical protein
MATICELRVAGFSVFLSREQIEDPKGIKMPDDLQGFVEWRDKMEARVSTLERTAKTEARARAGMDQDISDLNLKLDAQGRLLRALADTQSEHTTTLARHTAVLTEHTLILTEHTSILTEHTSILTDHTRRLSRLEAGQADHTVRLNRLEVGMEKVLVGVQTIVGLLDGQIGNPPE